MLRFCKMNPRSKNKIPIPSFRKPSEARSRNMRAISSSGNKTTELRLRSILQNARLRGWKVRPEGLPGAPDFFFPRESLAIFTDGCFWHGCPYCGHIPKRNKAYWFAKISRNRKRDSSISRKLRTEGCSVLRFWECQLKSRPAICLQRIRRALPETDPDTI